MQVEVINARELDAGLEAEWRAIQADNPLLAGPYFSVQYTKLAAEVRHDVFVAVMRDEGEVIGFLPFQRTFGRVGRPVSGPMSDYQAFICRAGVHFRPREIVKKCGLDIYEFDHLIAAQAQVGHYHRVVHPSPIIDLSRGFDAYINDRRDSGSNNAKKIRRMARVLARDVGEVRYEYHATSPEVLQQVVAWKRQQCHMTGTPDLFGHGWAMELLERIHACQDPDFAGVLSALWAGDRLAAGHMGMRSSKVWHYWFPSYNRELHSFSPGLVLLFSMAEDAPSKGIQYIDLGKGESQYKDRLKNGELLVAEGRVALPSVTTFVTEVSERSAHFIRRTPLIVPARVGGKYLRMARRWADYR
jgi:CelD/BcsL family acetyltransferase involved in cellulose biosynthesis